MVNTPGGGSLAERAYSCAHLTLTFNQLRQGQDVKINVVCRALMIGQGSKPAGFTGVFYTRG